MDFLTQVPNTTIGWVGLTLAVISAGFTAYLVYNRNKDGADDRLIKILKETVDTLEKRVTKQDEDIRGLTKTVTELKTTNETLTKVLQGRDDTTLTFQREVLRAVGIGVETNEIAKRNEKSLGKLIDIISAHIVAIETAGDKGRRSL
jgi:hypothetical protein